jgi:hypothetical protein
MFYERKTLESVRPTLKGARLVDYGFCQVVELKDGTQWGIAQLANRLSLTEEYITNALPNNSEAATLNGFLKQPHG